MTRLRRSCLTVPGSNPRMLVRARQLGADEVILDLEDSVPPSAKNDETRGAVTTALLATDWKAPTRAVRVNAVSSKWCLRDVEVIAEGSAGAVNCIVLPKVERPSEIHFISHLLDQLQSSAGDEPFDESRRIGIEAQIESPLGLLNIEHIASASDRLEALIFGPGDFAAAMGIPQVEIGVSALTYPGDRWHYVRSRLAITACAHGLQAIDGPYGLVDDLEGLRTSARCAMELGFSGKWVLHPDQIDLCNAAFTPSESDFRAATELLEAFEGGEAQGGAIRHKGQMVDEASRKVAASIIARGRVTRTRDVEREGA